MALKSPCTTLGTKIKFEEGTSTLPRGATIPKAESHFSAVEVSKLRDGGQEPGPLTPARQSCASKSLLSSPFGWRQQQGPLCEGVNVTCKANGQAVCRDRPPGGAKTGTERRPPPASCKSQMTSCTADFKSTVSKGDLKPFSGSSSRGGLE
uniref:Uncharacterized protein n=1 Tax=Rangifer tarandus platyrhynchus TaxID=3082113 RepID=A0ACB0EU22_RANTA|nr:unnamed protein product [Rangifer tarandus platyrhynchus]